MRYWTLIHAFVVGCSECVENRYDLIIKWNNMIFWLVGLGEDPSIK